MKETEWVHEPRKCPKGCSHIVYNLGVKITVCKVAMENFDYALFCGLGQGERLADMKLAKLCGNSCSECESDQSGKPGEELPPQHMNAGLDSPFSTTAGGGVMVWKKPCDGGEAAVI